MKEELSTILNLFPFALPDRITATEEGMVAEWQGAGKYFRIEIDDQGISATSVIGGKDKHWDITSMPQEIKL